MRYLVTGAAGFIGSQVARQLLNEGHSVVGLDDMNDYYDVKIKEWRLAQLTPEQDFSFHKASVADYPFLEKLFETERFDGVANLAARAGVRASVADPWIYTETNITGTLNLLECCQQYDTKKLVLASTSSIYGETETPFKVSNKADTALSPYAATKKGAEVMCHSYHYLYDIDVAIPRFFTVYGPAGRPDMSYFKFMLKIDRGEAIPVYGDGKQSRDFTYVEDVAEATVRALGLSGYNIFNVGNDRPVELLDMIHMLEEIMGRKAEINWLPRHPADNPVTWADLGDTETLLNWRPRTPLETGLRKVHEWYQANREWLQTLQLRD